jgi:hypothetical protein
VIRKYLYGLVLLCASLHAAQPLLNAIIDIKPADKILEIYERELFNDIGFQEPKAIDFLTKIYDELKQLALPLSIKKDFIKCENLFIKQVKNLNSKEDRYKLSEKLDKLYFAFVAKFLIRHKKYFTNILHKAIGHRHQENELPLHLSYVFWLNHPKDLIFYSLNPYKKVHLVPNLVIYNMKDINKKLLLLIDYSGSYSTFTTYLWENGKVTHLQKMIHHLSNEQLKLDIHVKDFSKMQIFTSTNHFTIDSPKNSFSWDVEASILTIKDQDDKRQFKLEGDVWHVIPKG